MKAIAVLTQKYPALLRFEGFRLQVYTAILEYIETQEKIQ
jgi:hypothetical protein